MIPNGTKWDAWERHYCENHRTRRCRGVKCSFTTRLVGLSERLYPRPMAESPKSTMGLGNWSCGLVVLLLYQRISD